MNSDFVPHAPSDSCIQSFTVVLSLPLPSDRTTYGQVLTSDIYFIEPFLFQVVLHEHF